MGKFCYLGDMFRSYGGASEKVNGRIGSAWEKFNGCNGVMFGKKGFSLKKFEKYTNLVSDRFFYDVVKLIVADGFRLHGVDQHVIVMCRVKLVDRVSIDVFRETVNVSIKTEDILVHSRLQWHGHVICQDTNLLTCEVMQLEIEGKSKKGCTRKLCKVHINDLVLSGLNRKTVKIAKVGVAR